MMIYWLLRDVWLWQMHKAGHFKWDFQWIKQSFRKIPEDHNVWAFLHVLLPLVHDLRILYFKIKFGCKKNWYCKNWIKITANMVEYTQLGFFFFLWLCFAQQHTEVKHKPMCSGNIVRNLMVMTLFFWLYVQPQHELFYVSLFWPLLNSSW